MPVKKAIKAASAATRTRAPQTTAKAAGKSTLTRESRRASRTVVSESAEPLQGLVGLNAHRDAPVPSGRSAHSVILSFDNVVLRAVLDDFRSDVEGELEHMNELFGRVRAFQSEERIFLSNLDDARSDTKGQKACVRIFAARVFIAAYKHGMWAAFAERNRQARQTGGAR